MSCVRTAKALVRLRGCAGSPEPSLVAYVISTIISCAGSFLFEHNTFTIQQYWTYNFKYFTFVQVLLYASIDKYAHGSFIKFLKMADLGWFGIRQREISRKFQRQKVS